MALKKFVINPFKTDTTKTLTSFEAPKIAQSSQPYQPPKKAPSLLTPEAQARGALLPVSRGGLAPAPATTTTRTTTKPAFDNEAALAGLQRQAAANNALYESQQQQIQEAPIISEAEGGGEVGVYAPRGGSGTTGAGAGGYTPPGLSPIEEEGVDTEQPTPGSVQAQPFTNPQGSGAIAGGAGGTQPQTLASKYESGFNAANAALGATGGGTGGITSAQGASLVNQYSPSKPNTPASIFVQSDPFIEGLVSAWQQFIAPQNQRASLADTYNQMLKDSGVQAIDMELVNSKRIIEGTIDDIRAEITAVGSFATESQVSALTNSRNKSLIRNYNPLPDARNAKEKYLQTAIQLEQADRQAADQRFESAFSMGLQIANYGRLMKQDAIEAFDRTRSAIGWGGILQGTQGDPYAISLIEKAYGLPANGLRFAAQQEAQAKLQAQQQAQLNVQEQQLDMKYKQAQISNIYSEIAQRNADNTMVFDPFGKLMVKPQEAMKINKEMVGSDAYKALTKAKDSLQFLKQFEDTFSKTGGTSAVFSPRQNAKLKAEYNATILNLKEFFNLGVLNGPDEAILRSVLPDPTNRSAALSVLSLGIYKPSAATKAGIDNMNKMIEASLDDRFKSLSSQYGDYSPYSVNGLRDLNRVYVEQKAKLDPNIQQLISENPDLTADDILMIISQ